VPDDLLEFPCRIPVKVFVRNTPAFRDAALTIVRAHFAEVRDEHVSERLSSGGAYLSLTVDVYARSRAQIDALYRALSADESIVMAL
jgi:hypothetical protein